ncbi:hypothetical protein GCG54_00005706 [Colletotrichum gloeosporioides]|uniref:Aspartate transaminase n=1 Tax=Colletotrichum gloeosporioides TaxID=474922 RepID=A0A8H4FKN3_COLGL|nr:uncharacterized protein GCG54_00005706 [Colletotrichum gloeosporioides]KAF3805667.1 hypothetical protein GCG54_00005706 [Colletotrichum gloeosporioides]
MFEHIKPGPPDPMFDLKRDSDNDQSPEKVDLGVGIYRNESGLYQELEVVKLIARSSKEGQKADEFGARPRKSLTDRIWDMMYVSCNILSDDHV